MQSREYQSDDLPPSQPASGLASPWARLAAAIIDLLIIGIPTLVLVALAFTTGSLEDPSPELILASIVVFIVIFVIQMVLLGTRGQTIGKIALNIRIVDSQTGVHPGGGRLILLRTMLNAVLTSIPFLGGIYWLADSLFIFRRDHRTIHDHYSETCVVKV